MLWCRKEIPKSSGNRVLFARSNRFEIAMYMRIYALALDPELEGKRFEDFLGLSAGEELADLEAPLDNPFNFDALENWSPEGTRFVSGELVIDESEDAPSYYNGELIRQPRRRWTFLL